MTKQQKINELELELDSERQQRRKLASFIDDLSTEANISSDYHNYSSREAKIMAFFRDCKLEVAELRNRVKSYEGRVEYRVSFLERENSRLWYLIRAMTNDQTLVGGLNEVANYEDATSLRKTPFTKPNF